MITIDDFVKVELKVGRIVSAEEIEGSDKLLKLVVDFGEGDKGDGEDLGDAGDMRQVLSGIKQWYAPADLVGKQFVFVTNLAPRKMMGLESQAMIMAAEGEEKPIPLTVGEPVPNGAKIR